MFSPPNLKEEILDVLARVSIISVFTVGRITFHSEGLSTLEEKKMFRRKL